MSLIFENCTFIYGGQSAGSRRSHINGGILSEYLISWMELTVAMGLLIALIVRCATPLPGWRNGVIFAGVFSNWGYP